MQTQTLTKGVRPHGNGFIAEPMFKGRRHRHIFKTELSAAEWLLKARDADKRGLPIPVPAETLVAAKISTAKEVVDHTFKMRWASQKSADHTLMCAMCFVRWVGPSVPASEAFTTEKVHDYVAVMMAERKSGSTINRHLARISAMAKMAKALKLIADLPHLPRQKEGMHRIRYYEHHEEEEIHAKLREWGFDDWVDYFIFLADMGTRPSEAARFDWRDYRNGVCHFAQTKNDLARSLKPTTRVVEALKRQRARHHNAPGPFAWVTPREARTLWDRLRTHIKWLGPDTVMYTFRHTCASRLTIAGVDLNRIKTWMGHKTIITTLKYAHLAPSSMDAGTDALEAFQSLNRKAPEGELVT
jgi:integrase